MIRLAIRLTLAGGRAAAIRLISLAVAVAIGTGLLLATLSGVHAVNAQGDRYAWLNAGVVPTAQTAGPAPAPGRTADSALPAGPNAGPGADPMWWLLRSDYFDSREIIRVDLAATGPGSPVPPGLSRPPGPDEYYVSPALNDLLAVTPADQLADRFAGRRAGIIGDVALPAPDSLLVVVGRTPDDLAAIPGAAKITGIPGEIPPDCGRCVSGIPAAGLNLVLGVVAAGLLFPVLMFIGTATRLDAARREQRFAAMRLVGATPRQVDMIATVEAGVSALAGTVAGFGLFYAFRDPLAAIPFTGAPFFATDFVPGLLVGALVAVGVPVAAAVIARLALRRVRITPLGVSRRQTPAPPRAYRLILLFLGLAELLFFVFGPKPGTSQGQVLVFLPGFLVTMIGLVVAGPWLTMTGAKLIARHARRPAGLIAARRLADNPKAAFRSVSGLVLALFVTTVAVGVLGTIVANRGPQAGGAQAGTLVNLFRDPAPADTAVPAGLAALPGVRGVATVRQAPEDLPPPTVYEGEFTPDALASCADIARTPDFGRCEPGTEVAWVLPDLHGASVWPAAPVTSEAFRALPTQSIVVGTDGSGAAIERSRTILGAAFPMRWGPITEAEWQAGTAQLFNGWKRLADVVVVAGLVVAGCSLAAGVAGGLTDRKRPFAMLRLAGTPLGLLRRVVVLESSVPLLTAAVVAIGAGLIAAHLFLTAQMDYSLEPPGPSFYLIVAAGLAVSLGIIAATMPLLRRMTGPAAARSD
jgi:hypothetical protein